MKRIEKNQLIIAQESCPKGAGQWIRSRSVAEDIKTTLHKPIDFLYLQKNV